MKILFCLLLSIFVIGCAEITPPKTQDIIREPLGATSLRIGMSKEKVLSLWGKPDMVKVISTNRQGMVREEWLYRGRYPNLPINVEYLSETYRLIFDGNNLVQFYHLRNK